ncbi:MAG: c-type cytochrome [bacterium]
MPRSASRKFATVKRRRTTDGAKAAWGARGRGVLRAAFLIALAAGGAATARVAEDPAEYYRAHCFSCHTIGGGRLTGPDLKDVRKRQDRAWLVKYIQNPKAVLDSGDPYALELLAKADGDEMPVPFGMTGELAEALLDLVEAESKLEESHFVGLKISDAPFTAEDIARGGALFEGRTPLKNGGPSCLSCHGVADVGSLGGGRLGPDLTKVYERLEGRLGLAMWLYAPATATMQPVYREHPLTVEEILALVALFEKTSQQGETEDQVAREMFFLLGLGGAAVGLVLFNAVWFRRFRAVRRPLVAGDDRRGEK